MGEIINFNAFKKRNEGIDKKDDGKKVEKEASKKGKGFGLARINPEKLDLIIKICDDPFRVNQTTKETAEKHFENFTEEELVDFINNSNVLYLKSKPTYFLVAFEKLRKMFIGKLKEK